jgi:hypothetical protein
MKSWTSADEAETLKRQQRAVAKLKWKRKDKVTKTDLENIYLVDGCVKAASQTRRTEIAAYGNIA